MKKYTLMEWWLIVNSCFSMSDILNAGAGLRSMAEYYDPETFDFLYTLVAERKMQLALWENR